MTLDDCGIDYTAIDVRLLESRVRAHVLNGIQVYRDRDTKTLTHWESKFLTKHTREQKHETLRWMLERGLVEENPSCRSIDFVPPIHRVLIPSCLNYNDMTMAEIRTLITFLAMVKGKHFHDFSLETTWEGFAETVGIERRSLQTVMKSFEERHLFTVRTLVVMPEGESICEHQVKRGKKGCMYKIRITMLDPRPAWQAWTLKDVAAEYRKEKAYRGGLPVHDRYEYLLARYEAKGSEHFPQTPVDGHKVWCPFCQRGKRPSLSFSSMTHAYPTREQIPADKWLCKKCGKGGNSLLLWARLFPYACDGGPEQLQKLLNKLPDTTDPSWVEESDPKVVDETVEV